MSIVVKQRFVYILQCKTYFFSPDFLSTMETLHHQIPQQSSLIWIMLEPEVRAD